MTTPIEKFSPSHLKSLEICPGWRAKEFEENEWSLEGKKLHECLEHCNDLELRRSLSQEQLDQIVIVEAILKPLKEVAVHFKHEIKLRVADLFEIPELRNGIIDLVLDNDNGSYHVIDFKFGRKKVDDASDNIQLAVYGAAIFLEYPDARQVTVSILQPRLGVEGTTTKIFSWEQDFLPIMDRIKSIIAKALDPTQLLHPQVDNCKYCSKYFQCDAVGKLTSKSSTQIMPLGPISRQDIAEMLTNPISAEKVLTFCKFAKDWCEQAQKEITKKVSSGVMELEGYKTVSVKGKKQIRDQEAFKGLVLGFVGTEGLKALAKIDMKEAIDFVDKPEFIAALEKSGLIEQTSGYSYLKACK